MNLIKRMSPDEKKESGVIALCLMLLILAHFIPKNITIVLYIVTYIISAYPILKEAIEKANELLVIESKEDETKAGMGTTIVAAVIDGKQLYVANVGDSRLYVIGNTIKQITKDHSLVNEMVRMGEIDESEARMHPDKNIITRAIGAAEHIEVDFFEVELCSDDVILLCSDGLTNMVSDGEIFDIIKQLDTPQKQVNELVRMANKNGGRDNITAMIVKPFLDEVKKC